MPRTRPRTKGKDKMKNFPVILAFELKSFFRNKAYIISTVLIVAVIAIIMFFPRIRGVFGGGGEETPSGIAMVLQESEIGDLQGASNIDLQGADGIMMIGAADPETAERAGSLFAEAFPESLTVVSEGDEAHVRAMVEEGKVQYAFFLHSATDYTYYVENMELTDDNPRTADDVMRAVYQMQVMEEHGIEEGTAREILNAEITHAEVSTGKDQSMNFFYTYIMIFALYMVILLYGQMVATNVATEKSSRAMELLITSAKPVSMMFGKVVASGIAGLIQLVAIFGGSFLFYNLNKSYWGGGAGGMIIGMIFNVPVSLLLYMLVFFLFGYFFFAMVFGAIGSTVSKVEDISTAITPAMIMFFPGFFVSIFAMTGGGMDATITKVFSFLPFSSPFVMFTRIAMSNVPAWEIILSIAILIVSTVLVGILAAKIYRVGVLLYGKRPNIIQVAKSVIRA